MNNQKTPKTKTVAENRKARHEYELFDRYEAGIELKGTEIKSIRKGKVQMKDSYISIKNNQAAIKGLHISEYEFGNRFNHDETRDRRLLLHKNEILKLDQAVRVKGYTLVPIRLYISHGLAKIEVALAKGKNLHDKRQTEKNRDAQREIQKHLKQNYS
ncbi:SsrA-binding protein SmpB [Ileibacterium valens]|uniref:SsrA-binding protein SmpB n=1 Tax=Ileibacterium valens TaxID=1862668 RepID=UPI00272CC25A|nr:SsrA-binding protein SmpB [Ileibacterium valens]